MLCSSGRRASMNTETPTATTPTAMSAVTLFLDIIKS
jgi:hypothetical protein